MENTQQFADALLRWFDQHGRKHLPWQQSITPYRVWVSEIMLQQTQVATVVPYYEKFMARFPNVTALAEAPLDDVLHHWSGLGYYSRAKNLHKAAIQIVERYAGKFPSTQDDLEALPGIGRSTAGAIRSIAFEQQGVILDGNVKRVIARLFAIEGWPQAPKVQKKLWAEAEQLVPSKRNRDYSQAMMDMGATLCKRSNPLCDLCPFDVVCQAKLQDRLNLIPGKKPKKVLPVKHTIMLVCQRGSEYLLYQRPLEGLWPGLWSFPEFACGKRLVEEAKDQLKLNVSQFEKRFSFRHTFSHFHLEIDVMHAKVKSAESIACEGVKWFNPLAPEALGLAAPITKIFDQLSNLE